VKPEDLADRSQLASLADETPEGRSIVVLAKTKYQLRGRHLSEREHAMHFIPFSARTRMSGMDVENHEVRKGAADAVSKWVVDGGGRVPDALGPMVEAIAREGATPLVVAEKQNGTSRVLGVVRLKDVVKGGMRERFDRLRAMGIRTVMITGDNPLTAAAIAKEAGVDDFLAEAAPEDKLALIRREQSGGRLVAMTGDGTTTPALAQADVGVAMNTGTGGVRRATWWTTRTRPSSSRSSRSGSSCS
jgi:K+-transporting ATPase ATPase B chain